MIRERRGGVRPSRPRVTATGRRRLGGTNQCWNACRAAVSTACGTRLAAGGGPSDGPRAKIHSQSSSVTSSTATLPERHHENVSAQSRESTQPLRGGEEATCKLVRSGEEDVHERLLRTRVDAVPDTLRVRLTSQTDTFIRPDQTAK
jgi:hypothetical protein